MVQDLGNARSPPALELAPTFTTHNHRICLLLATGEMGRLRVEDAERLQVPPAAAHTKTPSSDRHLATAISSRFSLKARCIFTTNGLVIHYCPVPNSEQEFRSVWPPHPEEMQHGERMLNIRSCKLQIILHACICRASQRAGQAVSTLLQGTRPPPPAHKRRYPTSQGTPPPPPLLATAPSPTLSLCLCAPKIDAPALLLFLL